MSETKSSQQEFTAPLQPRRIGYINTSGLLTLMQKEISRFLSVYTQTLLAPMITTLLFYAIFALAFGRVTQIVNDVPYLQFLAPGLIMMTMVQNAFANTSSSIMISKIQGNIVDVLMTPLSAGELLTGYLVGGVVRGLLVGIAAGVAISLFVPISIHNILCVAGFAFLGTVMLSLLGIVGGIWSEKFDHIAAVTNFFVTPLTFLSGTFYSLDRLPPAWQDVAQYNPFFHMIDGFRYGFIGHADAPVTISALFLIIVNLLLAGLALWMFKTGYKLKS